MNTIGGMSFNFNNSVANPLYTQEVAFAYVLTKTYPVSIASQGLLNGAVLPSMGVGAPIALTASEVQTITTAKKAVYQFIAAGSEKFYLDTDGLPVTSTDGQATHLVANEITGSQIANFRFMASVGGGNLVVLYFS